MTSRNHIVTTKSVGHVISSLVRLYNKTLDATLIGPTVFLNYSGAHECLILFTFSFTPHSINYILFTLFLYLLNVSSLQLSEDPVFRAYTVYIYAVVWSRTCYCLNRYSYHTYIHLLPCIYFPLISIRSMDGLDARQMSSIRHMAVRVSITLLQSCDGTVLSKSPDNRTCFVIIYDRFSLSRYMFA